jgi:hypothetical protein
VTFSAELEGNATIAKTETQSRTITAPTTTVPATGPTTTTIAVAA